MLVRAIRAVSASAIAILLMMPEQPAIAQSKTGDESVVPAGGFLTAFIRQTAGPAKTGGFSRIVRVDAFRMDRYPVTNAQFLDFVAAHPQWRRSRVKLLFADAHYLVHWQSDLSWGADQQARQPVTNISWYAAEAFCDAKGEDIPTTDQWEYALFDQGRLRDDVRARALAWYSVPNTRQLPVVDASPGNGFGIHGLVGLIWEWTLDFAAPPPGSDIRNSGNVERGPFCGGASLGATDATDYSAFMRYSFRSCLKASYTTDNLGFRCAGRAP